MINKWDSVVYRIVIMFFQFFIIMVSLSIVYIIDKFFVNLQFLLFLFLFVFISTVLSLIILSKTTKNLLSMFLKDLEWFKISDIIDRVRNNLK